MEDSAGPNAVSKTDPIAAQSRKPDDIPARSWMVPITTVLLLGSAFCIYYFVYVGARREYLVNRNFRALAALGDHLQRVISTHGSILEFYADFADKNRVNTHDRIKADLDSLLVPQPEDTALAPKDRRQELRKDYLHYLAPSFDLTEEAIEVKGQSSSPRNRLEVQRRDGNWNVMLSALRHPKAVTDYLGSLEIRDLLKVPSDSLPFDDILLASDDGTVVYQDKQAGPQFTAISALLKAQAASADGKSGSSDSSTAAAPNDHPWRGGALHLTDVMLAGTRYKLFVQPILLDVFSDDPTRTEPAHEWVLCGLRTSTALEWEALSISYSAMIGFTALFFAICMGGPILKVLFINHRERFRVRELGVLALFLVLLAGVLTLTALQVAHFNMNADKDAQLRSLGDTLSNNIHDDLKAMRDQLQDWCKSETLVADLRAAGDNEVIRNTPAWPVPKPSLTPASTSFGFANNAYWTDDDGHQVVKWSTSGFVTPLIDVSKERSYTAPRRTYLDGTGPPFHFDSVLPPNKLQYLAALSMDTLECNPNLKKRSGIRADMLRGSAFVTGQPFSLIDPILPYGYGFALVDETGLVLFHSDKTKNGRENFREESDWSKELYAGTFGHAAQQALSINYLGKHCRALMVPVRGVTEAPWSLIVYTDLTADRTVALETMTMAATFLLLILAAPALLVAVWCLVRRPRIAPEWLWPNANRLANYWYQIGLYTLLIVVFLFLGFRGPVERRVIACAAVPYSALLLTHWCYRRYSPPAEKDRGRNAGQSALASAGVSVLGAAAFLLVLILYGSHLRALWILPVIVAIGAVPLLNGPRRYFSAILRYWRRVGSSGQKPGALSRFFLTPTNCYALSVLLLLLLMGVLMPMALFRGCMAVERRLGVKQAQLHLASAVAERWGAIQINCARDEIGTGACAKLKQRDSDVWRQIVLRTLPFGDRDLGIVPHNLNLSGRAQPFSGEEVYDPWFRSVIYHLHHEYNSTAAETLGVIPDRGLPRRDGSFPDWSWEDHGSSVTLRWHGVHPPGEESTRLENDLLITSDIPTEMRSDSLTGLGIALGVMFVMGGILWMLISKVFLIHVAPLKITGVRELAECIRQGRNVLVLVPPSSELEIESPVKTLDLRALTTDFQWAEALDPGTLPFGGLVEIRHFEWAGDAQAMDRKLNLLERFTASGNIQIAAVMEVPASTEDYRRMFPQLTVVDLREEPLLWLKQYDGPAQDLIWRECMPLAALWPLGAQLAKDIRSESIHSDDTIASEILERADPYYRLVWKEFTPEQKFVLSQLAEDGLVNPMNGRAIRQLMRRGFIVRDPQFRIMNESFRRFLRSVTTDDLNQKWRRESRRSGWGKLEGAFFTTLIVGGVFLLTTQNALWESSAAYVTTAFAGLSTMAKLFNTVRGTSIGTKNS